MQPRVLQIPYVTMPRDQETTCVKTAEGIEYHLTPIEARRLAIALLADSERAADMIATNERLAKRR